MPYSKSKARTEFEKSSDDLLLSSRKASFKNSKISYEHKILIFQSAIFLLSALIEEYLKTFVEDLIFNYKSKNAQLDKIPDNFRSLLLLESQLNSFKTYINSGDESKILTRLSTNLPHYKIILNNEIFTNQIPPSLIIGTKKYPSIKNLNLLYNRLGISKIIIEIQKKGKKDYEMMLKSFLDVRETIAHQKAPSITIEDVKRHYSNINEIIGMLDRVTYSYISRKSGSIFWVN